MHHLGYPPPLAARLLPISEASQHRPLHQHRPRTRRRLTTDLRVLDFADHIAVLPLQLDAVAGPVGDLAQSAVAGVLAVLEQVDGPARQQILGLHVLAEPVEAVHLVQNRVDHLEAVVTLLSGQVVAQSEDLERALVGHVQTAVRAGGQRRHTGQVGASGQLAGGARSGRRLTGALVLLAVAGGQRAGHHRQPAGAVQPADIVHLPGVCLGQVQRPLSVKRQVDQCAERRQRRGGGGGRPAGTVRRPAGPHLQLAVRSQTQNQTVVQEVEGAVHRTEGDRCRPLRLSLQDEEGVIRGFTRLLTQARWTGRSVAADIPVKWTA